MALVLDPSQNRQLERAVTILKAGIPVALPTETVYGLAAPAFNEHALASVFRLKNRPTFDPLIVHVLGEHEARNLVINVSPLHEKLMRAFWPGPLTLLFSKNSSVPDLCTAGSPWVAIRSPAHPVFRRVLELAEIPLAAPSANRFGRISPVKVNDVLEELGPYGLEAVVDGGTSSLGLESTVVKVNESQKKIEIVRLGSLSLEQIRSVVGGEIAIELRESGTGVELREAPGQLKSHYAPSKPLELIEKSDQLARIGEVERKRSALLLVYPLEASFGGELKENLAHFKELRILSADKNDKVAASRLFSTLRELDARLDIERILAVEAKPYEGLNLAINDRLVRASRKN